MENPASSRFQCTVCRFSNLNRFMYSCKDCYDNRCTDVKKVQQDIANSRLVNDANSEALQNLEEEVEFLRKWSFTPAEASGTEDVTLLCTLDGSLLHAHSLILSSKSEVFRAMLEEIDMKEEETKKVQIDEAGGDSVKAFLKFLYTAQVNDEEMSGHCKELVKLAHFYQVEALIWTLDNFICTSKGGDISKQSVLTETVILAYLYDLKETKKMVQYFVADEDPDNVFFDVAFEALQAGYPWKAHQFSRDIMSLILQSTIKA